MIKKAMQILEREADWHREEIAILLEQLRLLQKMNSIGMATDEACSAITRVRETIVLHEESIRLAQNTGECLTKAKLTSKVLGIMCRYQRQLNNKCRRGTAI